MLVFVLEVVCCVLDAWLPVLIDVLPNPLVLALVVAVFGLLAGLGSLVVVALFLGALDPG